MRTLHGDRERKPANVEYCGHPRAKPRAIEELRVSLKSRYGRVVGQLSSQIDCVRPPIDPSCLRIMDVSVDKTGGDELSGKVDDPSACRRRTIGPGAGAGNPIALYYNR
jgi:hypothetical protein